MSSLTREVLAWAVAHHNTLTVAVLRGCGISRFQQERLVTEGVLVRVSNGVYSFAGAAHDEMTLCVAACSHRFGLVLAGPTAARLWGLRRVRRDGLVHVIAPPHSHPIKAPWLRPYRTSMLDPADISLRSRDRIVLTSPARTAVDLARWLPTDDLRSVIDQIEHEGLGQTVTMRRVADGLNTRGRPWVRRFLGVLDDRASGGTRASHGESRLIQALRERGISDVVSQLPLDLPGLGRIRLDAAVERIRWGVEVDGHDSHFSEVGGARDRDRDTICDSVGWQVNRVATRSLDQDFDAAVDRLMAAYRRRSADVVPGAA
jgi:very-short-patch-repair endonuclease